MFATRSLLPWALAGAVALSLAACGDDDDAASDTTPPAASTEPPATEPPATEAPATEAPATEAPATEAPATEAPATEAPATEASTTDAPTTEAPTTDAPATAPATDAPSASTEPSPSSMPMDHQMVEVDGVDYAFENLPESVVAGTTLTFTNASDVELHELVAIRLPDDETRPVSELIQLPEEEVGAIMGDTMPAAVIIAPPGEAGFPVVGDGTLTEPGRYIVLCSIPIGADPAEFMEAMETESSGPPPASGGPPHFTAGMYGELVVEAA